jgi:hypothetical protein
VRNADPDFDGDDLTRGPGLHVCDVVGVLEAFAEPEVAGCGFVGWVFGCSLGEAFDVGGIVCFDFWGWSDRD